MTKLILRLALASVVLALVTGASAAAAAQPMKIAGDSTPHYVQWAVESQMPLPPRIMVEARECPEFNATLCAHPGRRLIVLPDDSYLFGEEAEGEEAVAPDEAGRRQQYVLEWETRQDEIQKAYEEQGEAAPPREPVPPASSPAPAGAEGEPEEDRSHDQAMYRFFFYHEVGHVIDLGEHRGDQLYRRIFGRLVEGSRVEPRELLADAYALCAFDRTKVTKVFGRPLSALSYRAWRPSQQVHRRVCRVLAGGLD
jgi:hypothetical protein